MSKAPLPIRWQAGRPDGSQHVAYHDRRGPCDLANSVADQVVLPVSDANGAQEFDPVVAFHVEPPQPDSIITPRLKAWLPVERCERQAGWASTASQL